MVINNDEIAEILNKHLAEMVEKLNNFEWPSNNEDLTEETLTKIIKQFKNHKYYQNLKEIIDTRKIFFSANFC